MSSYQGLTPGALGLHQFDGGVVAGGGKLYGFYRRSPRRRAPYPSTGLDR